MRRRPRRAGRPPGAAPASGRNAARSGSMIRAGDAPPFAIRRPSRTKPYLFITRAGESRRRWWERRREANRVRTESAEGLRLLKLRGEKVQRIFYPRVQEGRREADLAGVHGEGRRTPSPVGRRAEPGAVHAAAVRNRRAAELSREGSRGPLDVRGSFRHFRGPPRPARRPVRPMCKSDAVNPKPPSTARPTAAAWEFAIFSGLFGLSRLVDFNVSAP